SSSQQGGGGQRGAWSDTVQRRRRTSTARHLKGFHDKKPRPYSQMCGCVEAARVGEEEEEEEEGVRVLPWGVRVISGGCGYREHTHTHSHTQTHTHTLTL